MLCLYLYFVILIFVNSKTFQFGSDYFITLCISTPSNCYPFKVTTSIGEILIFNTDEMKDDTIYFMIENWSIKYKVKDLFKNNIFQIQYASWNAYWIFRKNYLDEHMITVNKDSNYILFN